MSVLLWLVLAWRCCWSLSPSRRFVIWVSRLIRGFLISIGISVRARVTSSLSLVMRRRIARGVGDGRLDCSRRTFGGGMDRIRRLMRAVLFFLVTLCVYFASVSVASATCAAGVCDTQLAAYAQCMSASTTVVSCTIQGSAGVHFPPANLCATMNMNESSGQYFGKDASGSGLYAINWCVPLDCSAYDSGSSHTQYSAPYSEGGVYCDHSCMSVFHGDSGVSGVVFGDGSGGSFGHFVGNGTRCLSAIDASLLKQSNPPPPLCDHDGASCYNRDRGFCATTESGEVICEPAPPPGAGSCAVGATGATCVGNGTPPPAPPDPPIGKDAPPTSSGTADTHDPGGTTNNYTQNNYSGTSPGPGTPASGSSAGGGSQSNTSGNGNSPGPNGSAGTGSDGKCGDGSVPTASGCSGTFTDVGCDTPPACFGDAVMCGNAKENWATRCAVQKMAAASASSGGANYGDPSSALAAAGVPADGGASGDPSASGLVSSSDLGQDGFDASGLGFSRTCPASPQFSVLGHSYTLDLTPLCNFASLLGWFVLLCAFLVSLRIVSASRA